MGWQITFCPCLRFRNLSGCVGVASIPLGGGCPHASHRCDRAEAWPRGRGGCRDPLPQPSPSLVRSGALCRAPPHPSPRPARTHGSGRSIPQIGGIVEEPGPLRPGDPGPSPGAAGRSRTECKACHPVSGIGRMSRLRWTGRGGAESRPIFVSRAFCVASPAPPAFHALGIT